MGTGSEMTSSTTSSNGQTSTSTMISASTSESESTSKSASEETTTTEEECTDRFWCQWKPLWACRYWPIIRRYCPNKCGTCNEDQTTTTTPMTTPPSCEDRYPSWCRW